jgi:hypothetical protein
VTTSVVSFRTCRRNSVIIRRMCHHQYLPKHDWPVISPLNAIQSELLLTQQNKSQIWDGKRSWSNFKCKIVILFAGMRKTTKYSGDCRFLIPDTKPAPLIY